MRDARAVAGGRPAADLAVWSGGRCASCFDQEGCLMSDPLRVRMSGPLSVFAAGFREELLEQGYRPGTAANQLQLMAHLSRWLAADDIEPAALSSAQIERFVKERRASHARLVSTRALRPLLGYLRAVGVVPSAGAGGAPTPAGAAVGRFGGGLVVARRGEAAAVR